MPDVKNPYTEARRKANKKWDKDNLYRVTANLPKDWEEEIKNKANGSVPMYLRTLVAKDLGKE